MATITNLFSRPGERWLMADFHIHSIYSGGSLTPGEILKMAQLHLLDVVAISDHGNIQGAIEGQEMALRDSKLPFALISQEISVGNHFHFLLIGGNPKPWSGVNRNQLLEKFGQHRLDGGAIIMAHPWTMPKTSWASGFLEEIVKQNMLDAVELFNSTILQLPPEIVLQVKTFWEEWVVPNNLGVVGGSDFHYPQSGCFPGAGRTYLQVKLPGEPGIMEALHNRRIVAGLFSHQLFDLGWLGAGTGVIFGTEPWYGQLQKLLTAVNQKLRKSSLRPGLKTYLFRLMANGNYQMVKELLS